MNKRYYHSSDFIAKYKDASVCLFLVISTAAVYWQLRDCSFINFDDDQYVTKNFLVLKGLTWEGFVSAFSTFHIDIDANQNKKAGHINPTSLLL